MDKEQYITSVLSYVTHKYARQEIKMELEAHIEDRIDYYTNAGYDREYSVQKSIEHMGDAKSVGIKLNTLHSKTPLLLVSTILQVYIGIYLICNYMLYLLNWMDLSFLASALSSAMLVTFFNMSQEVANAIVSCNMITFMLIPLISSIVCKKLRLKIPFVILGIESSLCFMYPLLLWYDFDHGFSTVVLMALFFALLIMYSFLSAGHISQMLKGRFNFKLDKRYDIFHYIVVAVFVVCSAVILYYLFDVGAFAV